MVYCGFLCLIIGLILISTKFELCYGGISSDYVRNYNSNVDMPLNSDVFRMPPGYNTPQQVYITQGDHEGKSVIVSWTTPDEPASSSVIYWVKNSNVKSSAEGFTIGDGGNQEGLATEMTQPQPGYSAYREASFGHGILDIKNRTHAYFGWHRNT